MLNSGLFEHVFVHTLACKRSIIEKGWLTEDKVTVLLNGFDPMSHYPIEGIKKDIDVLFIGNMLGRRRKWLDEIKDRVIYMRQLEFMVLIWFNW